MKNNNFKELKINNDLLKNVKFNNRINNIANDSIRRHEEMVRNIEETRKSKESESLRRHEELIDALKTAGENCATIVIGDNANGIQIQQNSDGSIQSMENQQAFNYKKAHEILKEIEGYFAFPQFEETFKDNNDVVKKIVEEAIKAVENESDPSLIKKSLLVLKDLAVGASGSLIASGILGLITSSGII